MNKAYIGWVNFYMELANKLLVFKKDRQSLISKIKAVYASINKELPTLDVNKNVIDIDPFTVFGLFNKGITKNNRIKILQGFANEFSIQNTVPDNFEGIPVLNNMRATFYWFLGDRAEDDIDNLWEMFEAAINYADSHTEEAKDIFVRNYNIVRKQTGVKWNLTMGLFWIRPYVYINLDANNRALMHNSKYMPSDYISSIGSLNDLPEGTEYLKIIEATNLLFKSGQYEYVNYPELSHYAWTIDSQGTGAAIGDQGVRTTHYWTYSPGEQAVMWDEFYNRKIMAIGWSVLGDLRDYSTKESMKQKMKECIDANNDHKNSALATWQFVKDVKPGDIIFVKKGVHRIIGRGVVTSDYIYDDTCDNDYKNIHKIEWTHKGEWEFSEQLSVKTLTDVTPYTEFVKKLNALFEDESEDGNDEAINTPPEYSEDNFLEEVYMNKEDYEVLSYMLKNKKNVILQGAPGVGKTFAAKRLAYSLMGEKDSERVMMIQFHQSYSYEDFIMGIRPTTEGYEIKKGPFYNFCKKAEQDFEKDYYFIIDEINRGNLSKIFGELFMLIENDKRGIPLQLLYNDEKFAVPPNVHIIGMMNTADRSLAMLDYALRRRFAFFNFPPAFDTEGFCKYRESKNNKKFDRLIETIEKLNVDIEKDETLGSGFRIGHSYFCVENEIDDLWLKAVITYEIVPLLKEYWFDEPGKVHDWEYRLHEAIK